MRWLASLSMFLALLLSSCGKPRYWVKELVLPPGANEVSRKEAWEQPAGPLAQSPPTRKMRVLHVRFDAALDWPAVAQHFAQCLSGAGYAETADASLFGESGHQPDYRYYTSSARKEAVLLHDHQPSRNQMAQVGLGRRDGPGRYELTVMRSR
jgi:hypothetical protein